MDQGRHERFELVRPDHVGEAHWDAISVEIERLDRALNEGDDAQSIGYLKCLVEAVAKVVLDINGTPVANNESFDAIVKRAHDLLAYQPGRELAVETPFGNLATQARKMAISMGKIRNDYGAGHGRARQPEIRSEMVDLALDGSLLWLRWALRRLGYFSQGRPETLIRDLIGDPEDTINFYRGDLTDRLNAANLPAQEDKHARAIGVAVGQRASQETFNVRIEGVDRCIQDDDLARWPSAYRIGVATGLLFSPEEMPTFTARNLHKALQICAPITDASEDVSALLRSVIELQPPGHLQGDHEENSILIWYVKQTAPRRPEAERPAWETLAQHLELPW